MEPNAINQGKTITQQLDEYLDSSKNRSIFVGAATFIFLFIFIFFGIIPAYSEVFEQIQINERIDTAIDEVNTKKNTIEDLITQLENNTDVINYFEERFADGTTQENPIIELLSLARVLEITLTSISFGEKNDTEFNVNPLFVGSSLSARPMRISFTIEGQKESVLNFVDFLENSRRLYHIESLSLSRVSNQSNEIVDTFDIFTMNISLFIMYWQPAS